MSGNKRHVSFWRAIFEAVVATGLVTALFGYAAHDGGFYAGPMLALSTLIGWITAWRLQDGQGSIIRRLLRLVSWTVLLGIAMGAAFELTTHLPGVRLDRKAGNPFGAEVDGYPAFVGFCGTVLVFPMRLWLFVMSRASRRLRWQLTVTYMAVGVATAFLLPIAFLGAIVAVGKFTSNSYTVADPQQVGRAVADAIRPQVLRGATPAELSRSLNAILAGSAYLPDRNASADIIIFHNPEQSRKVVVINRVRRMILLAPDRRVIASAGEPPLTTGAPLPPGDQASYGALIDAAAQQTASPQRRSVAGRRSNSLLPSAAATSVTDGRGRIGAILLVENLPLDVASRNPMLQNGVILLAGLTAAVVVSILMILVIFPVVGGGIGYFLARPITRRIDRLTAAAQELAGGNLGLRVDVDSQDEIGTLATDFNRMAERLGARDAELLAEKRKAEALLDTNRQLVVNVSHELRTPVTTLTGYLEVLEREHGEHLPAHDLAVIHQEIGRLTMLIEDLFVLTRIEAAQIPLEMADVDVHGLCAGIVATLAPLARHRNGVEIINTIPENLPAARADRARFEQALLNLVQNALRHTPPGGIVAFEGRAQDGFIEIVVADTGIGIPTEDLPHIFKRFYRGDRSRTRGTGGAGLGLALVLELTEAMGGSVTVESVIGTGTRFIIRLPAVRSVPFTGA